MNMLSRPKTRTGTVKFATAQQQQNHEELRRYLQAEGISWQAWVMRREAAALPFFRTKYAHQQAREETG